MKKKLIWATFHPRLTLSVEKKREKSYQMEQVPPITGFSDQSNVDGALGEIYK